MTYIYVDTTHGDHATVLTDTWSYTFGVRHMGISDKCRIYPSRRLAVVSQGDVAFSTWWCAIVETLGSDSADLDQLNRHAPALLREEWARRHADDPTLRTSDTLILHVGWSTHEGRFTLTVLDSRNGFDPQRYDGVFVHPTPIGYRFSPHELDRAEKDHRDTLARGVSEQRASAHEANMQTAREGTLDIPSLPDDEHHTAFAEFVRDNRSRQSVRTMHHVLVGGSLYRTTLTRDAIDVRKLHDFPDDPAVFAGTLHPLAQASTCHCGNQARWIDCHGGLEFDDPCRCRSGAPFRECCAIADAGEMEGAQ